MYGTNVNYFHQVSPRKSKEKLIPQGLLKGTYSQDNSILSQSCLELESHLAQFSSPILLEEFHGVQNTFVSANQ